jgi:hypothetical protein
MQSSWGMKLTTHLNVTLELSIRALYAFHITPGPEFHTARMVTARIPFLWGGSENLLTNIYLNRFELLLLIALEYSDRPHDFKYIFFLLITLNIFPFFFSFDFLNLEEGRKGNLVHILPFIFL